MELSSLGRYQLRGEIGRGSMGIVYRGHDPVIDRPVALKTVVLPESLSPSERERFLQRFFLEARVAGKLIHPNIVVTYDAATDEASGTPFIAMEFIDGEPLSQRLAREGRLPWKEALDVAISIARALDYAHQDGVVHRDVKPANVMISRRGIAKITDFGIAKLSAANFTQTGVVLGTPYFMSPEQLRGEKINGRSDLFSLGAVLYNLILGQPPFEGSELAIIASQVLYKNPRPLSELVPGVPPDLDGVLARALSKSADERYGSATELADDLLSVRQGATPQRALSLGARTAISKVPHVEPPAEGMRAPSPATEALSRPAMAPSGPVTTRQSPGTGWLDSLRQRLRASRAYRLGAAATLFASLSGCLTLWYREEIRQRLLFYEAKKAVEQGALQSGEEKLEALLERNPEFEGAAEILSEVSLQLLKPALPFGFGVRHEHRIGSCTGRLTLEEWGIEYRATKHGLWQWRSHRILALERKGPSDLSLETNEEDMLGLLKSKRYNFVLLDGQLAEKEWTRYRRLLRQAAH